MWSAAIVEVDEAGQAGDPLGGIAERAGAGPLGEEGPDHPLGLAVRLGPVRPRPTMAEPELITCGREVGAAVAAAVVGEDALDRDPMASVEVPGSTEEAGRRRRALVGQFLGVGQAAVVVDRDVDPVPADAALPTRPIAGFPAGLGQAAAGPDAAELLGIEMDEFARVKSLDVV